MSEQGTLLELALREKPEAKALYIDGPKLKPIERSQLA